jgi:hypothetical protein
MRDATRLVLSKQILQSYPEEDKPGNRQVTGDKHALAALPGVSLSPFT